jgi:hypothetical protein
MVSVPAHRRGIANGVRSMLQNAGYVLGTAVALLIVTGQLPSGERRAAYAGELSRLPGGDLDRFVHSNQLALLVMAVLCGVATLCSLGRASAPPGARTRDGADGTREEICANCGADDVDGAR